MNAVAIIAIIAVCVMVIGPLAGNVIALLMMEEIYRNKPNSDLCFRNLWDRAFGFGFSANTVVYALMGNCTFTSWPALPLQ